MNYRIPDMGRTNNCLIKGKLLAIKESEESQGISGIVTHGHGALRFYAIGKPEEELKAMKKDDYVVISGPLRYGKKQATNMYLRVANAYLQNNEKIEESNLQITGNIATIKEFSKGALVSMINHEQQPDGKRIDTPIRYFLSGEKAELVKNAAVGSYIEIKGSLGSKKDEKTNTWFDNIYVTEVKCLEMKRQKKETIKPPVPVSRLPEE